MRLAEVFVVLPPSILRCSKLCNEILVAPVQVITFAKQIVHSSEALCPASGEKHQVTSSALSSKHAMVFTLARSGRILTR